MGVVLVAREKVLLSLAPDTAERLRQYAYEQHKSMSQVVTDYIWSVSVKYTNLPGQTEIK